MAASRVAQVHARLGAKTGYCFPGPKMGNSCFSFTPVCLSFFDSLFNSCEAIAEAVIGLLFFCLVVKIFVTTI